MRWLHAAAAVYTGVALVRYFFPPHIPRYQVETAFFIFAAAALAAILTRRQGPAPPANLPIAWIPAPLATVLALAAALLIYRDARQLGFLSDDFVLADWAVRRDFVHLAETGFLRPGVPLMWALLDLLPGSLAAAAHVANVALHAVNAVLVGAIARRMDVSVDASMAAGILFLTFPGLSEAIVWASGAQDVLMTTFALASIVLATSDDARRGAAALAAIAALSVKETAVVIPVLAVLVLWAGGRGRLGDRRMRAIAILGVLSAAYLAARVAIGVPSTFLAVDDWRYFAKQLVAGAFATLGAPWTAGWARAHAAAAAAHALMIVAVATLAGWGWFRGHPAVRQLIAAAAWIVASVLPVFSLFYVGPNLEGARYVYLAAPGFSLMLAVLIENASARVPRAGRQPAFAALLIALVLPLLPAIRDDLNRWQAAAAVRGEILAAAREPSIASCSSIVAEGRADNVAGAYVFRHGLLQAIGIDGDREGAVCRVEWTGIELVVKREPH